MGVGFVFVVLGLFVLVGFVWFCFVFNGRRTRHLTDDHIEFKESLSLQWGVNN